MFIDNECYTYLNERPLCKNIRDYQTKIFSQNTKQEFLEYLDEIESQASAEHFSKIKEVYGETWPEPYIRLYKKQ